MAESKIRRKIEWSEDGAREIGKIDNLVLFNIHDTKAPAGSGVHRYQLEVRFLDQRWTSDSVDDLYFTANLQLDMLVSKLLHM